MEKHELNNVEVPPSRKARGLGGGVQIRLTTVRSKDGWRAVAVLPNQMGQNHVALSLSHTHTHTHTLRITLLSLSHTHTHTKLRAANQT